MNEVLEAIRKRRSVRLFKPEQITRSELDAIINAGLWAPSSHNTQPWHLTVIQDAAMIKQLSDQTKQALRTSGVEQVQKYANSDRSLLYDAPTVIVVAGSQGDSFEPIVDCAAAIQNMLVAAESLGIGSCWIGLVRFFFDTDAGKKFVPLPESYVPYYAVCLGYKQISNGQGPQRKPGLVNFL